MTEAPSARGLVSRLKHFVGHRVARPLLYGVCKWGMRLDAIGRKPQ